MDRFRMETERSMTEKRKRASGGALWGEMTAVRPNLCSGPWRVCHKRAVGVGTGGIG